MVSRMDQMRQEVRDRQKRHRGHHPVTIALDAMGADKGPEEMLQGAFDAVQSMPHITVICTGHADRLKHLLRTRTIESPRILIQDATQVVGMDEQPKDSLKKKDSSVTVAARLVHQGLAHGMVSPGNTGATMATAMRQWRMIPGISRPAIAAIIPTPKHPCTLLDVGANVDCKPHHLLQFGLMGSVYSHYVYHRRSPKIGLLSIGEEACKGNDVVIQAHELMKASTLHFGGNAEGRDLLKGSFDVVVCDGFVGNVVLKFGEGLAEFLMQNLKEELNRNIVSQLGALAMMPAFKSFKKRVDYAEYGGAPLLGLNGTCIICHGSSRAKAIMNAIRVASEMVETKVNAHIAELVQANQRETSAAL